MNMLLVARRDLLAYLGSLYGYIVMSALLLIDGALFYLVGLGGEARLSTEVLGWSFFFTGGCSAFAAVLLSMRAVAEERDNRTELVLESSPISSGQVILGKYLAVMVMLSIFILLTVHMPLLIFVNGKVSIAQIGVGYLGVWLLASMMAAIGIFSSSIAKVPWGAQLLALVIALVIMLFGWLFYVGAEFSEPPFDVLFEYIAIWNKHFEPFKNGRLATSHVVYYVSGTWLFLTLATRFLERRH